MCRKVEFSNLGVTFIFDTPAQDNIRVIKNNKPDILIWPAPPPAPRGPFNHAGYVSKFRLVDTSKNSDEETNFKVTLEVRYKQNRVQDEINGNLQLGIHDGRNWLNHNLIRKCVIDDRSRKWHGSWLVELDLPADPLVAWGP